MFARTFRPVASVLRSSAVVRRGKSTSYAISTKGLNFELLTASAIFVAFVGVGSLTSKLNVLNITAELFDRKL